MKKTFIFLVLLLQFEMGFSQTVQTTNGGKGYSGTAGALERKPQYIPPTNVNSSKQNGSVSVSESTYINDCYKALAFTVKNYGYNKNGGFYSWGVKVTNKYAKAVQIRYKLIVGGVINGNSTLTYKIPPGATYSNDYGTISAIIVDNGSTQYRIEVSEVCFEGQDCYKNGYADCSGNQVRTTGYSTNNPTSQTKNTQTTSQNDPTFDRNNANFQDYYKRATAAGQAGNYDEAITLWNSAISVAVNDVQKDNARAWLAEVQKAKANATAQTNNALAQRQQQLLKQQQEQQRQQYNSTVSQANTNLQTGNYTEAIKSYGDALKTATTKTEKNIATTGVIASGVGGFLDALAKAKEEKRERERIEQAQRERERLKNERVQQQAINIMEANWQSALNLAKENEYNQAIKIMLPYLNANKINAYSTALIGFWYYSVEDYKSAKICYEKALNISKKSCAMHYLGTLYEQGKGVEMNYETALFYYKQSCDNEDKTGCENYEKLKPVVDEAKKNEADRLEKAKILISRFDFKPYLDYLVSEFETQGIMFDNITSFCEEKLSKTIIARFLKNGKELETTLQIKYDNGIKHNLYYSVNNNLRDDFSKVRLTALIG